MTAASAPPLGAEQVDEFIQRGWTLLRHAFPPAVAQAVQRDLGGRIGVDLERPELWTEPRVWLKGMMARPPYTDALTERFRSAVDQLVGAGRWEMTQEIGWWPTTFPGFDDPPYGRDWHIEGGWFRHHVWSPEQALLNLFCFSTVDPGGGGTLLVEGSHHLAARILWEAEPEGLAADDFDEPLTAILNQQGWPGVIEVVAEEGDVVLAHPLLFHSSNPNHGTRPRVMAQPAFSMTEPKRTDGEHLFPVEVPIARACPSGSDGGDDALLRRPLPLTTVLDTETTTPVARFGSGPSDATGRYQQAEDLGRFFTQEATNRPRSSAGGCGEGCGRLRGGLPPCAPGAAR